MAIFTATSRIKNETDISSAYDLSKWNNCIRHECKPQIIQFTAGRNIEKCARCPIDKADECTVYPASMDKWNKFNPNLFSEFVKYLDSTLYDCKTGKMTYFFTKPDDKIKKEFWEKWQIIV